MSKEKTLLEQVIIQSNFFVFGNTFHRFFLERGNQLKGKILEQREKIFRRGHIPVQI